MSQTYCNSTHITGRKGTRKIAQLTGDPSGETVDTDRVQSAIDEFAEKMNASLRKQYPKLPFGDNHLYLRGLNIEGAYLILERDSERGWTDEFRSDWKLLMKQLDDIRQGRDVLETLSPAAEEKRTDNFFSSRTRLFRRNSLSAEI